MDQKPLWKPSADIIANANITQCMSEIGITQRQAFHQWTVSHYPDFWRMIIKRLDIRFKVEPHQVVDLSQGIESPRWLPGAKINIADSCFKAPTAKAAIIHRLENGQLSTVTYAELDQLSNRVANALVNAGYGPNDAIAIIMPFTLEAIAIYFGIIKMGGIVVSIADSFSSQEMATRLTIANTKLVFTQESISWGDKQLPLYEKVKNAYPDKITNVSRDHYLSDETHFTSVPCEPMQPCHILFSSGTTGEPKAIPWNHTTPIKVASDAFFHQDIHASDVLTWHTNLGWMMGPWLLFATLINQATIAIYTASPKETAYGEFIQHAKVTMLGVVPTLVSAWKQSACMASCDWQSIKVFSSTGECSNPNDMAYLMSLAGNKPIIEYCGGTEIGGAYVSSTVIDDNYPSLFSTPTMGLDFTILDESGHPATLGEVAIIPPSIGLSTTLVNANHHEVYYQTMPTTQDGRLLRRHGDQIEKLANGYYCLQGRVDDTMNLSGIKISASEIERTLSGLKDIAEVAAIANTHNGPSQLIIYAVTTQPLDKNQVMVIMQQRINQQLNPLFKIHDVIFIDNLPKTASNKIMRRLLRTQHNQ